MEIHIYRVTSNDQQGNVINYTVDEAEINTDDLKFYTKSINGNKVNNTFVSSDEKTSVTVTKTWNDNNNANGKRPESIKLQIKNGNTIVKEEVEQLIITKIYI